MHRQKILITGASSGLGAGMARAFAAKGRDLALCARRVDRLEELKAELTARHPGITVAIAALDVNDHEAVADVFARLAGELGGLDRVIVNAGLGKGAPLGTGHLAANVATIETNLVAALVQIEHTLEMFRAAGAGHLVLVSSLVANRGLPGTLTAYAASKSGLTSIGQSLRAEFHGTPIKVTVLEPGYIESEMTARSNATKMVVDTDTGVAGLVKAIEAEQGSAVVPAWPWRPVAALMRVAPTALVKRMA
ncbi:SDR family oxidoreductase [Mycolicibacterium brumae]|uniref:Short chain dehydrogenase n=1 Tax=Mycolicibacterium brumae TaxID=85968 RepID=A0A2G5PFL1_9MYCO|nr:SDR family oxidoreductase [Mycolicibacterium brumae]MCV7191608.1 SDR family oxidoreductase [Mycolicibacterium brumae]PIB76910.1 short chain dehydrogenase [Mycolicibacterium brumae]RWA20538.1 hypothetical protein MBRU_02450 [Mycolicibacterium brumae DSM 44177]UWW07634.1 SDR family oxidoreductase [Mycolicibacterium brumae]